LKLNGGNFRREGFFLSFSQHPGHREVTPSVESVSSALLIWVMLPEIPLLPSYFFFLSLWRWTSLTLLARASPNHCATSFAMRDVDSLSSLPSRRSFTPVMPPPDEVLVSPEIGFFPSAVFFFGFLCSLGRNQNEKRNPPPNLSLVLSLFSFFFVCSVFVV